jgi:hypothetical protein
VSSTPAPAPSLRSRARTAAARAVALAIVCSSAAACGKSRAAGGVRATASSEASASAARAASAAAASPSAPAARRPTPASWTGTYESTAGSLYIPPDWKHVHWAGAETSAGIGEGSISLTLDPTSGRVTGTVEGPLGPGTLDGRLAEGTLTASLHPQRPSEHGFAGTLEGAVKGDHAEGTIHASLPEASALRTAIFTLSPATGAPATPAAAQ